MVAKHPKVTSKHLDTWANLYSTHLHGWVSDGNDVAIEVNRTQNLLFARDEFLFNARFLQLARVV